MRSHKADQIPRVNISILVNDHSYESLMEFIDFLMFKRIPFLERMIPKYVTKLNNEQKFDYKIMKQRSMHRRSQPGHSIKVLKLDTGLVGSINDVCKKKHLPRDLFFEAVFEATYDALYLLDAVMSGDVFDDSALAPSTEVFEKHLKSINHHPQLIKE